MSASNATRTAYRLCTEISARCPVEKTVLGYYPNFGANIFFAVGFGLCFLATVGVGTWKRTWSFTIAIAFGCVLEMVGESAANRATCRKRRGCIPQSKTRLTRLQATSRAHC